jgi:hypothetical protein
LDLHLTFLDVTVWLGITAIILIATSELISPRHGQTRLLIEKKRLEGVAVTLGILFLLSVMIQIYVSMTVPQ